MNRYVTGSVIKRLREEKNMTQQQLAERIFVSDKTISKWETGKGYPDISIVEEVAKALGISVLELFSGDSIKNRNINSNMTKVKFYVCPICGNVVVSVGEALISCCGITLPPLEPENADGEHNLTIEKVEDEYYITSCHSMSKEHYISFIASVKDNSIEITKLYPESSAETRFKISRTQWIYFYCNKDGLFRLNVKKVFKA